MIQLGLSFEKPLAAHRDQARAELLDYLKDKDWMTAEQIGIALGWADRKVRRAASDCDKIISYPGSPGYKLVARCTVEEYHHYRNAMRSQARDMIGRVMRTDRQFFGHPTSVA